MLAANSPALAVSRFACRDQSQNSDQHKHLQCCDQDAAPRGVEAAASSGGQFMPPVMGAVAFVMADFTGIPYVIIIAAALMPALFYYGSLFIAVWVEAGRLGIKSIPKEEREVLTRDDWIKSLMFFVPVFVIIGVLMFLLENSVL